MSRMLMEDRLLSPKELAAYLGVSVQTVYAWRCRGGGPPCYHLGRHVRYRLADVEEWLASRRDDVLQRGMVRT